MPDTGRRSSKMRDGGYQGSSDPGQPTDLMQPQTRPATCRHEWVLGDDGCVNCGESWAALHPEDEVASPARRGLNRLLASFPAAEVVRVYDLRVSPWVLCDLQHPELLGTHGLGLVKRFAIWKTTGDVYESNEHGAVGAYPVIRGWDRSPTGAVEADYDEP